MKLERNHIIMMNKNVNESTFVKQIHSSIETVLKDVTDHVSMEQMADVARKLAIFVDEDEPQCQHAKEVAETITAAVGDMPSLAQYKTKNLPLQGELWKKLSKLGKELCRQKKRGDKPIEMYITELRVEQTHLWKKQREYDITESLSEFVTEMANMSHDERHCFLKWIKYLLDATAREELSELREAYKQLCKTLPGATEKLAELDKQISDSSLGLEHFKREIGQVYEAEATLIKEHILSENSRQYTSLPSMAADLMLDGFPLELLDGDASSISEQWVSAVLTSLSEKLGPDTKIAVLTVLGVQSTGKSTLLNTMFGLQFAVSSGRCTRGAFMQLIKITGDLRKETGSDFLMIIDTEGLKAPELAKLEDSHEHDNELATLVVGLSDVTLVNIAMENSSEMKDVLQIVVHAFLRMKEVGHKPNCQFIHQNVGEVSAHDQNMRDRKHLLDQLNEMTKAAAKMEKKDQEFTKFSDIMEYDLEKNNWYIPGLWHGVPPMASVNTGYSENVFELKKYLFDLLKQCKGRKEPFKIHQFTEWMKSLWNAVKYENFIFSFRNSLVADAYSQLSLTYSEWEWQFRKIIHSQVEKAENNIGNHPLDQLDDLYQTLIRETSEALQTQKEMILTHLDEYFNSKVENIHLVEKFKTDFTLSAESLQNELEIYSKRKCEDAIQRRKGMDKLVNIQEYQGIIQKNVCELLQRKIKVRKGHQPALHNAIDKKLGVEIVEDVKASCTNHEMSSTAYLQAAILLDLLEEHCVENYTQYIEDYKHFARPWIRKRIIKNYREVTKIMEIVTKIIRALIRKTKDAIKQAMVTEKECVSEFLTEFCDILKNDFVINKGSLEIVLFQNANTASDFAADLTVALDDVEQKLISDFHKNCDIEEILPRLPMQPDEEIFREVLGCGKMCPFCGVPCERGGSGHKEHFAAIHRPKGLNSFRYITNEKLVATVCNSAVASDALFR
eukprot:g39161.t1